jgi:hypothetical protein
MTGRLATIFCLALSLTASAADSQSRWQFRKELDRSTATGEEILAVPLDSDIYAATRDGFPDVRIIDDRGAEVPYLVEPAARRRKIEVREPCDSKVVSGRPDEGKGLEIVVALDDKASSATGATIRTPLVDFEHRVRVSGSRNGTDWALLVSDGVIFDYTRFMDVRNRDVVIPANDYRQLKFVVERELDDRESPLRELIQGKDGDGKINQRVEISRKLSRPFRVDGIELWRTVETDGMSKVETIPYSTPGFHVDVDANDKVSRVEIQSRREPLTRLSLTTASRNFSRAATVSVPLKTGLRPGWIEVGRGTLSLIQFRAFRRAQLNVDFPEQRQELYRIVVETADNPALEITGVEAEGTSYRLVFLGSEGRSYHVNYGSDTAEAPQYDTAAVLASLHRGFQPVAVKLGPQIVNPGYRAESGLRDLLNSPIFLTFAIVAMVLVLAWALFRAGQRIKVMPRQEL